MADEHLQHYTNTYKPAIDHPQTTRRERILVTIAMWGISIAIHVALFYVGALIIDWRAASFEIDIQWGSELNGFGMFGEYDDAYVEPESVLADVKSPEIDENPFEDEKPQVEPDLVADNIDAPPEPEPEPEPEPDPQAPVDPDRPKYDLARDKQKLAYVRNDISGMPNLHVLAPGDAKLIVLIRNDRIIGSRFEQSARKLLKSFPYYRYTLGNSNIDPVKDINALLVATADPQLYAETFLVVSHKIPTETIKNAVNRSFPTEINWSTYDGHPLATPNRNDGTYHPRSGIYRLSVYLPNDNTVLFLKPELLSTLNLPHVDAIVNTRDDDINSPGQADSFLKTLGAISDSDTPTMPLLFFAVQGIESIRLPGLSDVRPPAAIQASISTDADPRLNLVATFRTPEDAKSFSDHWPDVVKASGSLGIPGIGGILDKMFLTPEDNQVIATGVLNGSSISFILMIAANYLSRD